MKQPAIEIESFGSTASGIPVERYTLRNSHGMMVRVINYGATVTELWTPDRQGALSDVVLGFDNLAQYETGNPYFGCMVGRVAFRIADAEFDLDGKQYQLTKNCGPHHAHGGNIGFNHAVWKADLFLGKDTPAVKLTHHSPDGDEGYPGTVEVSVVYRLTEGNELWIDSTAITDQPTLLNLTHHGYFNLNGAANGTVLEHVLQIDADHWLPSDEQGIPTGEIESVKNTPFDFTKPKPIGERIDQTGSDVRGYDIPYLRNRSDITKARVALIRAPSSGRIMEVFTSEPAIVLYTGNYLDGTHVGKHHRVYPQHAGVCMETGRPPDAVHHPNFPSIVLRPNEMYRHACIYRFSATTSTSRHVKNKTTGSTQWIK